MRYFFAALALVAAGLTLASPAFAHHSVTGIFVQDRKDTFEGRLVKIDWINPHIYIYVDVVAANGKVAHWKLESVPPAFMRRAGLTREIIMQDGGKPVSVLFYAPRNPAQSGNFGLVNRITYADGHFYQLGPL